MHIFQVVAAMAAVTHLGIPMVLNNRAMAAAITVVMELGEPVVGDMTDPIMEVEATMWAAMNGAVAATGVAATVEAPTMEVEIEETVATPEEETAVAMEEVTAQATIEMGGIEMEAMGQYFFIHSILQRISVL